MIEKFGEGPTQALGEGGKNQHVLLKEGNNIVISAGGTTATYDIGKL